MWATCVRFKLGWNERVEVRGGIGGIEECGRDTERDLCSDNVVVFDEFIPRDFSVFFDV